MALSGWQRESAYSARQQMEQANRRRQELLNPPSPELPSGTSDAFSRVAGAYSQAYGQARAANEQRYQLMLRIADQDRARRIGLSEQQLDLAKQTTGQRAADIRSAYGEQESDMMQRLARTGMANTTVAPTMQMGVARERESSLNRLADTMQQTRLGILQRRGEIGQGTRLGIMERRTDAYPDQSALVEAAKSMSSGYGAAGTTAAMSALSGLYGGGSAASLPRKTGSAASRAANSSLSAAQYRAKYGR
jgi:hypothetical protein